MPQDIFKIHSQIMQDYRDYISSFINISDDKIRREVENQLENQVLWPEPLIQFNPAFEYGESVNDLCKQGVLHNDLDNIFKDYRYALEFQNCSY